MEKRDRYRSNPGRRDGFEHLKVKLCFDRLNRSEKTLCDHSGFKAVAVYHSII